MELAHALAALALVAGCHKPSLDFAHHVYQGFALDVPTTLPAPTGATYAKGETRLNTVGLAVSVGWNVGTLPDEKLLPGYRSALEHEIAPEKVLAMKDIRLGAEPALRFDIRSKPDDFWSLAVVGCGSRLVRVMVRARTNGEATFARMLDHFECKPEPKSEEALAAALPVALDDRKLVDGWKRVPSPGEVLITDGKHTASFASSLGSTGDSIDIIAKTTGWPLGARTTAEGRTWVDVTTPDGAGVISAWQCGGNAVLGLVIGFPQDEARAFLRAFRCPRDGDTPFIR